MSSARHRRPLKPGVYVPTLVFFDPVSEDVDFKTVASHATRIARAGVAGIITQGSNGEAVHLSHSERQLVTKATCKALDDAGYGGLPVIVGCGAQSTRGTVELCQEAQAAGGDYALILPPSYYKQSYSRASLIDFFNNVATASPLPILLYNYPGAVAGIDLDSDIIVELAKHPNIVGCKLTCGNTGKLNRIASSVQTATPWQPSGFMCLGGSADFTLQTLIGGGSGIITGLGNISPRACVKVYELYVAGEVAEAQRIQAIVSKGDWGVISGGIVGTKSALQTFYRYGGYGRKPLRKPSKEDVSKFAEQFEEVVELETQLSKRA